MTDHQDTSIAITPLPIWQLFVFFGVPGLLAYLGIYVGVPLATAHGIPLIISWTVGSQLPIFALASGILLWYARCSDTTWHSFIRRFRLQPLSRREWLLYVPAAFVTVLILNELLAWTVPLLADTTVFQRPPIVPDLFSDPYAALEGGGAVTFLGVEARGQWWLIPYWIVVWMLISVGAEEIVWRGYLLPRMELRFGTLGAWFLNGIFWDFVYHLYTPYNYLSDLPMMLILPFLAGYLGKTQISLVLHSMMVGLALVILIPGVI